MAHIADRLRAKAVIVLISKRNILHVPSVRQYLLDLLCDRLRSGLLSVLIVVIQFVSVNIYVKTEILFADVVAAKIRTLLAVIHHANLFIFKQYVRHGVFHKVFLNKGDDVSFVVLRDQHEVFLFLVGEHLLSDHVVLIVVPSPLHPHTHRLLIASHKPLCSIRHPAYCGSRR